MLSIVMQAQVAGQPSLISSLLPFVLIGFVFYFLLIRPQNKRLRAHKEMLASVTRGDTIVTNGGLIGKVTKVEDGELTIDLGSNVKVKVAANMISDVRGKIAANDSAEKPVKSAKAKKSKK